MDSKSTTLLHFPSPNRHTYAGSQLRSRVREVDLDLVSTFSIWSLASSEDVMVVTM
ncbi:hypothetical protein C1H46_037315 [Malus baccata]|uniref:Uncharacterized protein n=1 Tax=Malus baccata TaxID=106549 RepID=A0A540KSF6_MALBA|nr:hypothetical protein C1H46_037315 [Malus baccata]